MFNVNRVNAGYGEVKVLRDISIEVNKGEMIFVIGRNGAGKTTLLKTIAGIMTPDKGSIKFKNNQIDHTSSVAVARLGIRYVAQDKKVFSNLTVRDNLELAAFSSNEKVDSAVKKVLEIYPDLEQFLDLKAGALSGGQREILLIGRALIGDPSLLLIDEPTEGLAATVIKDIFRILNRMKEKNMSAIIIEQNLSIVKELADRIYIMKEGKIIKTLTDRSEIDDIHNLDEYL